MAAPGTNRAQEPAVDNEPQVRAEFTRPGWKLRLKRKCLMREGTGPYGLEEQLTAHKEGEGRGRGGKGEEGRGKGKDGRGGRGAQAKQPGWIIQLVVAKCGFASVSQVALGESVPAAGSWHALSWQPHLSAGIRVRWISRRSPGGHRNPGARSEATRGPGGPPAPPSAWL